MEVNKKIQSGWNLKNKIWTKSDHPGFPSWGEGGMGGHLPPPILQFFSNRPPPIKTDAPPWGTPPT